MESFNPNSIQFVKIVKNHEWSPPTENSLIGSTLVAIDWSNEQEPYYCQAQPKLQDKNRRELQ